jgi:hypothetical protein
MDTHTDSTNCLWQTGKIAIFLGPITLYGDILCLVDDDRPVSDNLFNAVGPRVDSYLGDGGGTVADNAILAHTFCCHALTANGDGTPIAVKHTTGINITYDNLWGGQHQTPVVTDILALGKSVENVRLQLLDLGFLLTDLGQIFRHAGL